MYKSFSESYKNAGVDVTAGYRTVELIKTHAARTRISGSLDGLGGFGGMFQPDLNGIGAPVLVSGADGVGTKLKLAFAMDKHDTIGIDCVAMCVNDIICCGAKPLFFLDYLAMGRNDPEKAAAIVSGVADGCVMAGCALAGGETAEMPGFYPDGEYDLAGFSVGMADRSKLLDPANVREGDVLIALASSGVHSNGFSLVRKIFGDSSEELNTCYDELGGRLGDVLLTPTRIYVKSILKLLELNETRTDNPPIKSVSNITGGGFYENIPRAIPKGLTAVIERQTLDIPAIFEVIAKKGNIPERDMFNTFNMGTGMCVIAGKDDADRAVKILTDCGETAKIIGMVSTGDDLKIC